jgi:hypothetical protein
MLTMQEAFEQAKTLCPGKSIFVGIERIHYRHDGHERTECKITTVDENDKGQCFTGPNFEVCLMQLLEPQGQPLPTNEEAGIAADKAA